MIFKELDHWATPRLGIASLIIAGVFIGINAMSWQNGHRAGTENRPVAKYATKSANVADEKVERAAREIVGLITHHAKRMENQ